MRVIVTGGAGFIGSHLADALIAKGYETTIIDDLISGNKSNIHPKAKFVNKNVLKSELSSEFSNAEVVFHLAADPNVRISADSPKTSFEINVAGTFNVLEACRRANVEQIVFTSTSTVYGQAKKLPTPEHHPCEPISNYGASKLACEAYLSSYAHTYGIKGTVFRFANIFGPRSTHGIMYDFYNKLKQNPNQLGILGDGKQEKSYLYVSDCVDAVLLAAKQQKEVYDVFNVGSKETRSVTDIAMLMCKILKLNSKFTYAGTPQGWNGDVTKMLLDTKKLEKLGWKEKTSFEQGVKSYLGWLDMR